MIEHLTVPLACPVHLSRTQGSGPAREPLKLLESATDGRLGCRANVFLKWESVIQSACFVQAQAGPPDGSFLS